MNFRHTAVIAVLGWYLMVPSPFEVDQVGVRAAAQEPLSRWYVSGSYDTAAECAQKLFGTRQAAREKAARHQTDQITVDSFAAAQCIASNDPRLQDYQNRFVPAAK